MEAQIKKPVGVGLALGIILFPLIFVWYTLQEGRSRRARFVAFAWLGAIAVANFAARSLSLSPDTIDGITFRAHTTCLEARIEPETCSCVSSAFRDKYSSLTWGTVLDDREQKAFHATAVRGCSR